jgi:tRNA dimethylallyltransferase
MTGPTACGKTAFALELAARWNLEIINADSLLVYRDFNIGTAKPTPEERQGIPHHLIDIRSPEETYTAAEFVRDVERLLLDLTLRSRRAIIVGGTPFYLKALCFGLWDAPPTQPAFRETLEGVSTQSLYEKLLAQDSEHALKLGSQDRYRLIRALEILEFSGKKPSLLEQEAKQRSPDPRFPLWVMDRPAQELEQRISQRIDAMLASGLVDEVQALRERYSQARALKSVGYAQTLEYLDQTPPRGRVRRPGLDGLRDEIQLATRQLVKSQRTFFRGLPHAQWFLFEQERLKLEALAQPLFKESS